MTGSLRPLLLLAGCLSILALMAWLLLGPAPETREAAGERSSPAAEAPAPAGPTGAGGAGAAAREAAAAGAAEATSLAAVEVADSTPQSTLSGYVLDEAHQGIAGALVIEMRAGNSVRTDEHGKFTLAMAPLRGGFYHLLAWADGWTVEEAHGEFNDVPRIVLRRCEPRVIHVVDADTGMAIAGAQASLAAWGAQRATGGFLRSAVMELPVPIAASGPDGKLVVPALDEHTLLLVHAPGYQSHQDNVDPRTDRVALARQEFLQVQFVRRDASPLAGALVFFQEGAESVRTDAAGLAQVPPQADGRVWGAQVREEERTWIHLGEPYRAEAGAPAIVRVEHFARTGVLVLAAGVDGSQFEVATAGGLGGWLGSILPDPGDHPALLLWHPVAADGTFLVERGWQAEKTSLLVRRKGESALVHRELLQGSGPYRIAFAAHYPVRLTVVAWPPELLQGAAIQVRHAWEDTEAAAAAPLQDGVAQLELPSGYYRALLRLAEGAQAIDLGSFEVADGACDALFQLGRVRSLRGTVRAGGEPVFPCTLYFSNAAGWSEQAQADEAGRWQVAWMPEAGIMVHVQPADPWLVELERGRAIPDGALEYDLELPVATLEISLDPAWPLDWGQLQVQRQPLVENVDGSFGWAAPPQLPALVNGVARLRTSPCALEISTREAFAVLNAPRIELPAGSVRHLQLRAAAAGRVLLRLRGEEGNFRARTWSMEPLSVELPGPGWSRDAVPIYYYRESRAGMLRPMFHAQAGTWSVRVEAPITWEHDWERAVVDSGRWELTVPVEARRTTTVWLGRDENGGYQLHSEVGD